MQCSPFLFYATPQKLLGRVSAIFSPVSQVAEVFSAALATSLAAIMLRKMHLTLLDITFGPLDTIFTIAALLIIASGLYAMLNTRGITIEP